LPDLVVSSVSYVQTQKSPVAVYRFDVTVTNSGGGAAGDFDVTLWLDGAPLMPTLVSGLAASASTTANIYWTHPGGDWPYWAGAKADSGNNVCRNK
jgi:subtilase family serine protease